MFLIKKNSGRFRNKNINAAKNIKPVINNGGLNFVLILSKFKMLVIMLTIYHQ